MSNYHSMFDEELEDQLNKRRKQEFIKSMKDLEKASSRITKFIEKTNKYYESSQKVINKKLEEAEKAKEKKEPEKKFSKKELENKRRKLAHKQIDQFLDRITPSFINVKKEDKVQTAIEIIEEYTTPFEKQYNIKISEKYKILDEKGKSIASGISEKKAQEKIDRLNIEHPDKKYKIESMFELRQDGKKIGKEKSKEYITEIGKMGYTLNKAYELQQNLDNQKETKLNKLRENKQKLSLLKQKDKKIIVLKALGITMIESIRKNLLSFGSKLRKDPNILNAITGLLGEKSYDTAIKIFASHPALIGKAVLGLGALYGSWKLVSEMTKWASEHLSKHMNRFYDKKDEIDKNRNKLLTQIALQGYVEELDTIDAEVLHGSRSIESADKLKSAISLERHMPLRFKNMYEAILDKHKNNRNVSKTSTHWFRNELYKRLKIKNDEEFQALDAFDIVDAAKSVIDTAPKNMKRDPRFEDFKKMIITLESRLQDSLKLRMEAVHIDKPVSNTLADARAKISKLLADDNSNDTKEADHIAKLTDVRAKIAKILADDNSNDTKEAVHIDKPVSYNLAEVQAKISKILAYNSNDTNELYEDLNLNLDPLIDYSERRIINNNRIKSVLQTLKIPKNRINLIPIPLNHMDELKPTMRVIK